MRIAILVLFFLITLDARCQLAIPDYSIAKDSDSHITVYHSGNSARIKLLSERYSDTLLLIRPYILMNNGIVDHKALTGEMLVREYFVDKVLIGYIEYDNPDPRRELFFNDGTEVFLEKRYDNSKLIYSNNKPRKFVLIKPQ